MKRRIAGTVAFLLVLTTATACGTAAGRATGADAAGHATFSADSSGSGGSADSGHAAREDWLTKGGCRSVPPAEPSFTGTSVAPTSEPVATGTAGAEVLSVSGRFAPDRTSPITLDLAQLDAMPQVECTVNDREAEGRDVTFRGVLVADLLADIGAQPETTLHTAALNDYTVDLPISDIRDLPVLLATRLDGPPMSVAHYGPLRVIYPTTGYNLDPTVYDPRKIWQLSTVDVS